MKYTGKILAVLLALAILLVPAMAMAALPTPWTDSTMKIFVCDNFDGLSGEATFEYCPGGASVSAGYKDDQLWINSCSAWVGDLRINNDGKFTQLSDRTGVIGYGFYVHNTTSSAIGFQAHWFGGSYFVPIPGQSCYFVDMKGSASAVEYDENGAIAINAGFEGYILFPFASMKSADGWTEIAGSDIDPASTLTINLILGEIAAESGKALIIDNYFIYGDSTLTQSNFVPEVAETADLLVIGYAVVGLLGCGALAVSKRKK